MSITETVWNLKFRPAASDRRHMVLEVLVATMDQTDLSLAERMNLRQNAVIANQCGRWSCQEQRSGDHLIRMISSDTKGVGINRNLALQASSGDILLFADDDITYYDGDLQPVMDAFRELPDADVIFFAVDMTRDGEVFDRRRHGCKRLHLWNSLRYGACRMAVRREAVVKNRLSFSTLFGGGCIYGSGEDTIFIRDCFRAGLRVYTHPYVLGACRKDESSWFRGFDEKFMFDKGAMIACAFPKGKHILKWHFIRRYRKKSDLPLKTIIQYFNEGIQAFPELRAFGEADGKKGW